MRAARPLAADLRRRTGALVLMASAASLISFAAAEADGPTLRRLLPLDLPEETAAAVDVRWQEDGALLLGVGGNGVYSWRMGDERAKLSVTLAGSQIGGLGRIQDYSRVGGISAGVTVFSSASYGIFRHEGGEISAPKGIEIVGDLDQRYDRGVVVGLARGPDGIWENRLAWLVSDDGTVRGILPRRSKDSHWFLAAELGVVRVLSEDHILVAPGIEPDVFIYDWSGQLRDVVETGRFFADSPWEVGADQGALLTEPSYFRAWLSRHRVIDEVVADSRGNVFFFVRHVPSEIPLPTHFTSGQPRVTGGIVDLDGSGEAARPRRLTDEQATKLMELLGSSGNAGNSEEPVTISGGILNRILADSDHLRPRQRTKVCWDLVHAHVDDLQTATKADCVLDSEFADARLRADLRGHRAVVLIRGDTYGFVPEVRRSVAFEARIDAPER